MPPSNMQGHPMMMQQQMAPNSGMPGQHPQQMPQQMPPPTAQVRDSCKNEILFKIILGA